MSWTAGEHRAGKDPKRAGEIAHLCGEDGADQRSGAGDRGEMVTEQHVTVRRDVIETVIVTMGRRRPDGIDSEHLAGDEERTEPVGDEIDADRCDD